MRPPGGSRRAPPYVWHRTGDLPLNAKTGKTYVLNRRYTVLYRQVQSLFVMAVTAPDANLYAVADLSDNVGRLLISIMGQKGKRVEPERLAKKYGEVDEDG